MTKKIYYSIQWARPTLYALAVDGAEAEPDPPLGGTVSDGERFMLVDATVVSPVLALGRYAGGGAEATPPGALEVRALLPSLSIWSALSASQRRDS